MCLRNTCQWEKLFRTEEAFVNLNYITTQPESNHIKLHNLNHIKFTRHEHTRYKNYASTHFLSEFPFYIPSPLPLSSPENISYFLIFLKFIKKRF